DFVAEQEAAAADANVAAEHAPIPTVAQEDIAFREEFNLDAVDVAAETEIAAPAEPEDVTPASAASLPGGLLGSLSSLLSQGTSEVPAAA
ncbi:hypothetical protein ABTF25_19725, partial [Acinetobacter baumannii]